MPDSSALPLAFPRRIDRRAPYVDTARGAVSMGLDAIDRAIGGGLARARLHEIVADDTGDAASAAGFAAMCARRIEGAVAWFCVGGDRRLLNPHGLREIGLDPHAVLFVEAPDSTALLRAADEAVRCTGLGSVVVELWREPRRIDLTIGRRLVLAAEASGVTPLLLRIGTRPVPNAAQTRWSVSAVPSAPLRGGAPGYPTFDLELLRQRGGPSGMCWRVEWDRDQASFRAPLSGAVAAVPVGRPVADSTAPQRSVA